ncbi:TIGR00730 family Rossman fold protein [Flavobacteriaceae bacterium]|nr:TIGR00730 family Rossman fold protein [Flavobacteriaceae bacterium]
MKRITVFCGSSIGTEEIFEIKARELGKKIANEKIQLVYGGANIGLMAAVANGCLSEGGNVIGVLPKFFKSKEIEHKKLSQLILVDTMHERKTKMNELCDGVIALPGGFGTLEELFEMLTWGQLGLHTKPIGILNINGFYNELISLSDTMFKNGFLKDVNRKMVLVSDNIDDLIHKMKTYKAPKVEKWITDKTS